MTSEQFSVSWDNFHKNMSSGVNSLLENEDLVDVTLAVEGRYLKAHKMVLSVCSPYFKELFKTSPCKHPIVFMKDVSYDAMTDLLQFMYQGEVQISQENFTTFLKTAESLQIRGLSSYNNISPEFSPGSQHNLKSMSKSNPKRPRLNEHTTPEQIVKIESPPAVETDISALTSEELIPFKTEPYEDDNSNEDSLDETNADENEDYWIRGDEEEPQIGTSIKREDLITNDSVEVASSATSIVIPQKSKEQYEQAFTRFERWCVENNVKNINENVLMTYFKEKLIKCKPYSLGSSFSMLCSMILIKKNIDISKYRNLLAFLKRKTQLYRSSRSVMFMRRDVELFLKEADDEKYLMMKVAMIIGIAGACGRRELVNLLVGNVKDEGSFIRFQLFGDKTNNPREFVVTEGNMENVNLLEIIRKYINLRPTTTYHQRFFVSYRDGKCMKQHVGINSLATIPKKIALFLGLRNAELYTGHCFRRTSITLRECMSWGGPEV